MPDAPDRPERALFVFLDGVGLGPADANPLADTRLRAFAALAGGHPWTAAAPALARPDHVFRPLDATLGVAGLPQSGTGQAALFTGHNAPALHGAHYGPFPPTTVRPLVAAQSLFAQLAAGGAPADALAFANAYPERFFDAARARNRWTTTTLAARGAGVRLRTAADLARHDALAADLSGAEWRAHLDPDHEPIAEAEAARRLARLAGSHRLTLFEYFLTDKAGHAQDAALATRLLGALDAFFGALLAALDLSRVLLVVCSDHGNLEDLSTRSHTRNPVPLVARGAGAGAFAHARALTDVTPRLVKLLARPPRHRDTSR
ncbi:MAG: peptidase [Rubricoccaceae bacterium]